MKRFLTILAAAAIVAALAQSPARAGTTLSYSCFFPPTHVQSMLAESWCKEVEKRTNGEVTVQYYPGGTLTKAKQCYDGVVEGLSDVGLSVLAYSRGRFPVMAAVDLPMGYTDGVTATKIANGVFKAFNPKEFNDVKVMYFHAHGPGLLHTRGKAVKTLDDMKGLKLRATGNSAKVVKALGGTPVAMSMPDSYQAIQKGVVQGGVYPVETNKGWKMAEVVDYCTKSLSVAYTTTFFVVMNKDKWNELTPAAQKAISEINTEWQAKHGRAWDESDVVGMEAFMAKGGQVVELSPAESERWKTAAAPIIKAYIAEADSRNLPGQDIVDFIANALKGNQ